MRTFELLDGSGADVIEIGLPFSDPLADGPVIQKTSEIALKNGITTDITFKLIEKLREKSETPIALLTYFNMVHKYGVEKFLRRAYLSGINGLIIPDLPLEEFDMYRESFYKNCIDNIMIASLTSSEARLKKITEAANGFVYCVSLKGVTGARDSLSGEVARFLERLRSITEKPLAVGFGISNTSQVRQLKERCDGIIIGSKILDIILKAKNFDLGLRELEVFCYEILRELKER